MMRNVLLAMSLVFVSGSVVMAQGVKSMTPGAVQNSAMPDNVVAPAEQKAATTLTVEDLAFKSIVHDFGTVQEGPDATCKFTFVNNGKEPIIIKQAKPSCGCTVPKFSGEPVPPGATGTIDVAYHTKGKPNPFTKSITVISNAGTKVLTIKGVVEKAPVSSVPENTSMMKTR